MEEKMDVLDRDDFVEKLESLVEIISENNQGCCFGLNGVWGSGKSFVLNMFEKRIKDIQSEETCDNKYFVFHYDCWEYDYYEEPAIAIIAAMLDATDKELNIFSQSDRDKAKKVAWETVKDILKRVAKELCKNKIGIDLVELATNAIDNCIGENESGFDSLYCFKQALEKTRNGIREISSRKTVVIIVDELDRCLPEYTIKVLERLHHIFTNINNVIVMISMDVNQIEYSLKGIYGDINVDTYLRKLISFKVNLDNGIARQYLKKYEAYTSMFDILEDEKQIIEKFFVDIMTGMDIRTQERIFNKADTIHRLICNDEVKDDSIMTFEILFLTLSVKTKSNNIEWLIDRSHHPNTEKQIGKKYYEMLKKYEEQAYNPRQLIDGNMYINDNLIGKTFFWIANLYSEYTNGACKPFYYKKQAEKRVSVIRKFAECIEFVDCD